METEKNVRRDISHSMTQDEMERFKKAFKDPEFQKLFNEYAQEISDPANRKMYEEEILKMEEGRDSPPSASPTRGQPQHDLAFIDPEPEYVLKVRTAEDARTKVFINICKHEIIDKPFCEKVQQTSSSKSSCWSIPYATSSQARPDFDKEGRPCKVYDVVFNTNTLYMAQRNAKFKELVEDTALDAAEKFCRLNNVMLDRKSVQRPNLVYKGTPKTMTIRKQNSSKYSGGAKGEDSNTENSRECSGSLTSSLKGTNTTDKECSTKSPIINGSQQDSQSSQDSEYQIPKYTVKHRGYLDIQDFCNSKRSFNTRPKELLVIVELPLLDSAANIELDIFASSLELVSEKPAKYKLVVNLPFAIMESGGSAKFDRSSHQLTVTLPVKPPEPCTATAISSQKSTICDTEVEENTCKDNVDMDLGKEESCNKTSKIPNKEENSCKSKKKNAQQNAIFPVTDTAEAPKNTLNSVLYLLPTYRCHQRMKFIYIVVYVQNVIPSSVNVKITDKHTAQINFQSLGSGFVPFSYMLNIKSQTGKHFSEEDTSYDVNNTNIVWVVKKDDCCQTNWNSLLIGKEDYLEVRHDSIYLCFALLLIQLLYTVHTLLHLLTCQ